MTIDSTLCPLCGQRNQCAQAEAPAPVKHCWCFDTPIDRGALERLPAARANQACLCPRCAQGLPPSSPRPAASDRD